MSKKKRDDSTRFDLLMTPHCLGWSAALYVLDFQTKDRAIEQIVTTCKVAKKEEYWSDVLDIIALRLEPYFACSQLLATIRLGEVMSNRCNLNYSGKDNDS